MTDENAAKPEDAKPKAPEASNGPSPTATVGAKPEETKTEPADPVGAKVTLYFSLDDILAPAVEQELIRRGWKRANIGGLKTHLHESALLGFHVELERTE